LRVLNRLTEASGGTAIIAGTDVLQLRGAAARRWQSQCVMIFQQFNLVARVDVTTNVMLGRLNGMNTLASPSSIFRELELRDALAALDRLGIADQVIKRAEAQEIHKLIDEFGIGILGGENASDRLRSNDFRRGINALIRSLIFIRAVGLGPLTGAMAIAFTDTGTLGKLFSEALENVDGRQIEGCAPPAPISSSATDSG